VVLICAIGLLFVLKGGRLVYQYTDKRASGPKCPVTGKKIQGVSGLFSSFRLVWHYDVVLCSFGYVLSGQFRLCLDWQFWLCLDWAVWVRVQTLWWWDGVFVLLVMS
jgi:hypothetical protein